MVSLTRSSLLPLLWFALGVAFATPVRAGEPVVRERLPLDLGWHFHLGDEWGIGQSLQKAGSGYGPAASAFSDQSWRQVDLPHDWVVELPFDATADGTHGFKTVGAGFPTNSVAWYRRTFDLPAADAGRRLWLEFDGVFRDCLVYVNGWFVGHHEGGYNSFRYDITDVADVGGRNVVAVRVDAFQFEGWFYEGAGLYRSVWLTKTEPVALAPDSVVVASMFAGDPERSPAQLRLGAEVTNTGTTPAETSVAWTVVDAEGRTVAAAAAAAMVAPHSAQSVAASAPVEHPRLWSPESPTLYRLVTVVTQDGRLLDRTETEFGMRTVAFDADKGFLLNGRPYVLQGACNHQDHAGVGVAVPDRLAYYRIARLKEMGANAYRTAHHPPSPAILEACDRLGLLVMDESRLVGSDERNLEYLTSHVRRDRNHASVAIWSVGNEETNVQRLPSGGRVAARMQALIRQLDPTRPVTCNADVADDFSGINATIEVRGWSYQVGPDMDAYHQAHPRQPNVGSEQASTFATRGIFADDAARGYCSSFDDNKDSWRRAENWLTFFAPRAWLSGAFIWTGFDYRGEPTPYGWPNINSQYGVMDTCGFPKGNFWYYQAWWSREPRLHLLPHWNWPGRNGQEVEVRALSNCDEVELVLNGASLGRRRVPANRQLIWPVTYAPGQLAARGFRDGKEVVSDRVETTGPAAALRLSREPGPVRADGRDLAIVTVAVVDAQGRVVPDAGVPASLALEGPGRLVGVGNGDPTCHEPDVFVATRPMRTRTLGGWKWHALANYWAPDLEEKYPAFNDSTWETVDITVPTGPVKYGERVAFRCDFEITPEELAAPALELAFGGIVSSMGNVWLNGQWLAGVTGGGGPCAYDPRPLLKPGRNVIAVTLANFLPVGGVFGGAELRFPGEESAPAWQRSTFNGFAQVLVRAGTKPGTVSLTARADGLAPATLAIQSEAVAP